MQRGTQSDVLVIQRRTDEGIPETYIEWDCEKPDVSQYIQDGYAIVAEHEPEVWNGQVCGPGKIWMKRNTRPQAEVDALLQALE